MKPLRLITFDVTNTLIKIKTSIGHEYCKVASLYGINCTDGLVDQINSNFRPSLRELKKESPLYGVQEGITCSQWWNRAIHRTFVKSGLDESSLSVNGRDKLISTHLYKLFSTAEPYTLIDGAADTLTLLKEKKVKNQFKLGVISNSDERLPLILAQLGVGHFFDFIMLPQFERIEKPEKEVFHRALNKGEAEYPEEALHVGDDLNKDYLAAKNCSWNAILVAMDSKVQGRSDIDPNDVIQSVQQLNGHKILDRL